MCKFAKMSNNFINLSSKRGFTLAEVLITLSVIGIVVTITIPTLLQSTNDTELKAALKRNYFLLSEAANLIKDENGNFIDIFSGDSTGSEVLKNTFRDKLNYIKDCDGASTYGGSTSGGASGNNCWHTANSWKWLNGVVVDSNTSQPGLVLSNGTLVYFYNLSSACTSSATTYTYCAQIVLDVNGFKKPNTVGKDIFYFNLADEGLIPLGAKGYNEGCTAANSGQGCTAFYLYN